MSLSLPILFAGIGSVADGSVSGSLRSSPASSLAGLAVSLFLYALLVLLPICLLAWGVNFLLSLPMRRQERARFILDLLESALKQGRPLEQTLVDMANGLDPALGRRFHLLAAHLQKGLRLGEALAQVPRILPPRICAMLRAGEQLGDVRKVLPACRHMLKDAQSSVRGAASYLVVIAFVLSPFAILVLNILAIKVFPQFSLIMEAMTGAKSPVFEFVRGIWGWLIAGQAAIFAALMFSALLYVGGPRFARWFQFRAAPFVDWIAWQVPWKQKRLQRDCSAMLVVLLDGGVPETEALRLAGECADNEIFRRRVARARAALAQGGKLTEVVRFLDDQGEFRWRLANAVHARGDFLRALAGWHEALDAKAFQQEQAAAHAMTSALVLANGVLVALVAVAVFGALVSLIEAGVLW